MAAEVHQLGVDVRGHAAVEGGGEVGAAGHHAGAAGRGAFGTPPHQGTKSENESIKKGKKKSKVFLWLYYKTEGSVGANERLFLSLGV